MKNKDLEKLIRSEIQRATPHRPTEICGAKEKTFTFAKRPVFAFFSFALALCLCIAIPFSITGRKSNGEFALASSGSIILDINPSLELKYDKEGNITQIIGLNEDGRLLIVNNDYTGKNYKVVVEELVSDCVDLGYFSKDRENNAILITALDDKGEQYNKFNTELESKFNSTFIENGLQGVVISENDLKGEQIEGLTVQKSSLINKIVDYTEKEVVEYKEKSVSELYQILEEAKKEDLNKQISQGLEQIVSEIYDQNLKEEIGRFNENISQNNQVSREEIDRVINNIVSNEEFMEKCDEHLKFKMTEYYNSFRTEHFPEETIEKRKEKYKDRGEKPQNSSSQISVIVSSSECVSEQVNSSQIVSSTQDSNNQSENHSNSNSELQESNSLASSKDIETQSSNLPPNSRPPVINSNSEPRPQPPEPPAEFPEGSESNPKDPEDKPQPPKKEDFMNDWFGQSGEWKDEMHEDFFD